MAMVVDPDRDGEAATTRLKFVPCQLPRPSPRCDVVLAAACSPPEDVSFSWSQRGAVAARRPDRRRRRSRGDRAGEPNLLRLHAALTELAIRAWRRHPSVHRLRGMHHQRVWPTARWTACWRTRPPRLGQAAPRRELYRHRTSRFSSRARTTLGFATASRRRKSKEEAMGESSGVGLVELAILESLDARRAWPEPADTSMPKGSAGDGK